MLCAQAEMPKTQREPLQVVTSADVATRNPVDLVRDAVRSVVFHPDRVSIVVDKERLWAVLARAEACLPCYREDSQLLLDAPCSLARCRGVLRAVLPASSAHGKQPDPVLVKAVARAHQWAGLLRRGEVPNQRALAERVGLDERYVSRLLPLAFLSPRITEEILDGSAPPTLTLDPLVAAAASSDWKQQHRTAGVRS